MLILFDQSFSLLSGDLSFQIAFVPYDKVNKASLKSFTSSSLLFSDIREPFVNWLKRFSIGEVESNQGAMYSSIVHFDHRSIHFLASSVPDEEIYEMVIFDLLLYFLETEADRIGDSSVIKHVLSSSYYDWCLANIRVPNEDYFKFSIFLLASIHF